jgi:hypothetical protein
VYYSAKVQIHVLLIVLDEKERRRGKKATRNLNNISSIKNTVT